ncbi:alpha-mannosidase, partial [Synechococcus sp. BA-132 BA5]|nr:alpha-mannosidase [Synechococcus sp. BA-132 BA5]
EPLWCRPVATAGGSDGPAASAESLFPSLGDDLQLVALRPLPVEGDQGGAGQALLSVQNLGPCRRQLCIGPDWAVLERCDGLGQGLADDGSGDHLLLGPWQLGHWTLGRCRQRGAAAQSS